MTADQTREQHPSFFNLSMEDKNEYHVYIR